MYKMHRDSSNISGLADFCQLWLPTDWEPGANTPIVLLAMGGNDDTNVLMTQQPMHEFTQVIVDAGYGVVTALYGGSMLFGNSTARTQVGVIADYVQTHTNFAGTLTVGAGKIVTVGFSMGACTTLNWVGNLATPADRVKAFVSVNGLVDINYPGVASVVADAYPGGVVNVTDDPTTMAANGKYAGLNGWVCYASDDVVVPHASMTAFVSSTGATEVSIGAVGHQWMNIANSSVITTVISACTE